MMGKIDEGQFRKALTKAVESEKSQLDFFEDFRPEVKAAAGFKSAADRKRKWYNLGSVAAAACVVLAAIAMAGPGLMNFTGQGSLSTTAGQSAPASDNVSEPAAADGARGGGAPEDATPDDAQDGGTPKSTSTEDRSEGAMPPAPGAVMPSAQRDPEQSVGSAEAGDVDIVTAPSIGEVGGVTMIDDAAPSPDYPADYSIEEGAPPDNLSLMEEITDTDSPLYYCALLFLAGLFILLLSLFARKNVTGRLHALHTVAFWRYALPIAGVAALLPLVVYLVSFVVHIYY